MYAGPPESRGRVNAGLQAGATGNGHPCHALLGRAVCADCPRPRWALAALARALPGAWAVLTAVWTCRAGPGVCREGAPGWACGLAFPCVSHVFFLIPPMVPEK